MRPRLAWDLRSSRELGLQRLWRPTAQQFLSQLQAFPEASRFQQKHSGLYHCLPRTFSFPFVPSPASWSCEERETQGWDRLASAVLCGALMRAGGETGSLQSGAAGLGQGSRGQRGSHVCPLGGHGTKSHGDVGDWRWQFHQFRCWHSGSDLSAPRIGVLFPLPVFLQDFCILI